MGRGEIDRIRRLRNNLVHGIEIPNARDVREAGELLEALLPELRHALWLSNDAAQQRDAADERGARS